MKQFRRVLSVVLSFVLFLSMSAFPEVKSNAADNSGIYKITITDVVNENPLAADILDAVNVKRKAAGLSNLVMNDNMLADSMVRAAELTVSTSKYNLKNELYDSGDGTNNYRYEMILRTSETNASNIVEQLYNDLENSAAFSRNKSMKVGIGVVNINGVTGTKYICVRLTDNADGGNDVTSSAVRQTGNKSTEVSTNAEFLKLCDLCVVADKRVISNNKITIYKGQNKQLMFRVTNKDYKNYVYIRSLNYYSDAKTIASEDEYNSGIIVGKTTGTAVITMSLSGVNVSSYIQNITVDVPAQAGEASMEVSTELSAYSGYANVPVTGKITVKNGSGPFTYKVSYTIYNGATYTDLRVTYSGDTFTLTPFVWGTHTIVVTATGSDGRNASSEPVVYEVARPMDSVSLKADKTKVALGNSVKITATAAGGAEPITYKYAYKDGTPISGNSDTLTLTPESKGSYTVVATAVDAYNNSKSGEITFEVIDPIVFNVSAENNNIIVGEKIKMTASGSGGDGSLHYEFKCSDANAEIPKRTGYDTADMAWFSAKAAGKYTVNVTATDSSNNTAVKQLVIVVGDPLSVSLSASPQIVSKNQTVTLTAASTGGSGTVTYDYEYEDGTKISGSSKTVTTSRSTVGTYKVIVTASDAGKHTARAETEFTVTDTLSVMLTATKEEINLGDSTILTAVAAGASQSAVYSFGGASGLSSSGNKVTFKPSDAGSYTVTVTVNDGGKTATAQKKITVNPRLAVSLSCDSGEEVMYKAGSAMNLYFTANASGGDGNNTYKFMYNGTETDTGMLNYTSVNVSKSGMVTVKVTVTDGNGYTATAQASVDVIEPLDYLSLNNNGATQMAVGETMEFVAGSSGGYQPITYTFTCNGQTCTNGGQFTVNGNKMIFKPTAVGTYTIGLNAADRKGNSKTLSNPKTIKVVSSADKLKATVSVSKQYAFSGEKVTFTVNAVGGTAPYKYTYKFDGGTSETSSNPVKEYTPANTGTHTLNVTVTDADGTAVTASATVETAEKLQMGSVVLSKDKAVVGEKVTVTAKATGGFSPLKYTFTETSGAEFTVNGSAAEFTPSAAGTYTFKVYAADGKGNKSNEISKTLTVAKKLSVKLEADPKVVAVGTPVQLKPTVTGGFSTYSYRYTYADGTDVGGSVATPTKAGSYTVNVTVTDSAKHTATAKTTFTVLPPLTVKLTTPKTAVCVGDNVMITASSSSDKSADVRYTFTDMKGLALCGSDKALFRPVKTGTYTVKVTAEDEAGQTATASITLKAAVMLEYETSVTVNGKSIATSDTVSAGQKIEINSTASGGSGSYEYSFSFKEANDTDWFEMYSPSDIGNTAIQFDTAGVYSIKMSVRDSDGRTVTKTYTVTVK